MKTSQRQFDERHLAPLGIAIGLVLFVVGLAMLLHLPIAAPVLLGVWMVAMTLLFFVAALSRGFDWLLKQSFLVYFEKLVLFTSYISFFGAVAAPPPRVRQGAAG